MHALHEIFLPLDGLEAMRLIDLEGLSQEEAAARIGVSRQTLGRVLAAARRNVTEALTEGLALRIEDEAHHRIAEDGPTLTNHSEAAPKLGNSTTSEETPMKIAVTTTGTTLESHVDPHFGRAAGFLVVDPDTLSFNYIPNTDVQTLSHGAGIASAELVANAGATVVLTGSVGPKAFRALVSAGMKVGCQVDGMTVREAIEAFQRGNVVIADTPSNPGHVG